MLNASSATQSSDTTHAGILDLCDLCQVVTAWNGQGISAFALAARTLSSQQLPSGCLFPVDGCPAATTYMNAALRVAGFVQAHLWDADRKRLRRNFCEGIGSVEGECAGWLHSRGTCLQQGRQLACCMQPQGTFLQHGHCSSTSCCLHVDIVCVCAVERSWRFMRRSYSC